METETVLLCAANIVINLGFSLIQVKLGIAPKAIPKSYFEPELSRNDLPCSGVYG
jgi:hypothetical protein